MAIKLNPKSSNSRSKPSSKKEGSSIWDLMNKDIEMLGSSFGTKKKVAFYEQLETLLTAGLDIQNALKIIAESSKKQKDKDLVLAIETAIVQGATLSDALQAQKHFSLYEVYSIQIGEETGRLAIVLKELAAFFAKSLQYRRQLTGALSYPIFVTSFSIAAVFFLLRYLVPMFSGIYSRFDKKLPTLTQYVVDLSDALGLYAPYLFLGFGTIVLTLYWQRKQIWFRKSGAWLILHMPIFGKVIQKIYLARLCQSMNLLLSSKVPLLRAVGLVKQMIQFYPVEMSLVATEEKILHGDSLHSSLKDFDFYPIAFLALIKVGEESSKLDLMFERLANQYNAEVDQQTAVIGNLIEPILIIVLGVMVAVILIAMYLPLFQMSTNMTF